jgi:hypothetical protein
MKNAPAWGDELRRLDFLTVLPGQHLGVGDGVVMHSGRQFVIG